ncbi:MAG: M28 family peptidase [Candidatus Marinimicrobia bacterium]|jgi:hypothetical protein|nr:M28 family peptidase [Candidatus Neomarinimicrobiota bacterium]MDP6594033.1 M28 family peptidase [Candidatus Neomarinimicrobiota bacterium]MDP6836718.1 M28 family peptidase [Candidatus Neomarinimicrobiota bacterium]MDP6967422.1 M28 family peptidase [Candidatus Neomarinimicrobiota bacterium]|tara:strand:- start:4905 stop:5879 length:975 start_codon:yes stop_codon:yes gene_type:complete
MVLNLLFSNGGSFSCGTRFPRLALSTLLLLVVTTSLGKDIPQFDADRAFGYLEKQCSFGPRNPGSIGHRGCLIYLKETLAESADTLVVQPFPYSDPYSSKMLQLTNLVARFQPQRKNRIWIAAHWDTRPWADRDRRETNRTTPIIGANDGASGVAVLLELSHHLAQSVPPLGVDLVFLDGEDLGKQGDLKYFFNGSRYLARHIPKPHPRYCILVDMVGDKELELPMEGNSIEQAPKLVKLIWNLAADLGIDAFVPEVAYTVEDDHVILAQAGGIPSISIIDFHYPNRYKNYWHTMEDTPDKCSPASLKTVGTVLLHHIYGSGRK